MENERRTIERRGEKRGERRKLRTKGKAKSERTLVLIESRSATCRVSLERWIEATIAWVASTVRGTRELASLSLYRAGNRAQDRGQSTGHEAVHNTRRQARLQFRGLIMIPADGSRLYPVSLYCEVERLLISH